MHKNKLYDIIIGNFIEKVMSVSDKDTVLPYSSCKSNHSFNKSKSSYNTRKSNSTKQVKINTWRIIKLDAILQSGRSYTAKELAERVGKSGSDGKTDYSPRTIQRDLEYMRDIWKIRKYLNILHA